MKRVMNLTLTLTKKIRDNIIEKESSHEATRKRCPRPVERGRGAGEFCKFQSYKCFYNFVCRSTKYS